METTAKETPDKKRLAQLETEGQHIIDSYLKQVTVDANAVLLKTLQNRLKDNACNSCSALIGGGVSTPAFYKGRRILSAIGQAADRENWGEGRAV